MEVTYRSFQTQDAEQILKMLDEAHLVPSSIEYCVNYFSQNGLVAEQEGKIVGCGFYGESDPEGRTLCQVFVHPDARRQRIGTTIFWRLQEKMRELGRTQLVCDFEKAPTEMAFAEAKGVETLFSSRHMSYTGARPEMPEGDFQTYQDADYSEVQKLVSEAFYKMQQQANFPNPTLEEASEQQREEYRQNAQNMFIYRENNEIVGVIILDGAEIDALAVRVDRQGQGIGEKLLAFATNTLYTRGYDKLYLWVVVGNPAIRLYHRMHWVVESTHIFATKKL